MSNGHEGIDECKGADHPCDTPSANVWNNLACKEHAAARTVGFFDAADGFLDWDTWRARPTFQCAEMPPATGTTSLLHESLHRAVHTALHLLSAGGSARRQVIWPRPPMLRLGASAGHEGIRALPLLAADSASVRPTLASIDR